VRRGSLMRLRLSRILPRNLLVRFVFYHYGQWLSDCCLIAILFSPAVHSLSIAVCRERVSALMYCHGRRQWDVSELFEHSNTFHFIIQCVGYYFLKFRIKLSLCNDCSPSSWTSLVHIATAYSIRLLRATSTTGNVCISRIQGSTTKSRQNRV
jgi:hypothetical protein